MCECPSFSIQSQYGNKKQGQVLKAYFLLVFVKDLQGELCRQEHSFNYIYWSPFCTYNSYLHPYNLGQIFNS